MDTIIQKAIDGDTDAQMYIASCYLNGVELEKDTNSALLIAMDAADRGSSWANYFLGYLYFLGKGIEINFKESFKYYKKSATDFPQAYVTLGHMYAEGLGIKKNSQKAFKNYSIAAARNVDYGYFNVAQCYEHGIGTAKNISRALLNYKLAANLGLSMANTQLARIYLAGEYVAKNERKAIEYLEKGSKSGDFVAKITLDYLCNEK
jgi:TPR repeat protein